MRGFATAPRRGTRLETVLEGALHVQALQPHHAASAPRRAAGAGRASRPAEPPEAVTAAGAPGRGAASRRAAAPRRAGLSRNARARGRTWPLVAVLSVAGVACDESTQEVAAVPAAFAPLGT